MSHWLDLAPAVLLLQDLAKDAAPLFKKALRFYQGLSGDLAKQSHSLDVFACALDQVRPVAAML